VSVTTSSKSHWGAFDVTVAADETVTVAAHRDDPEPSALLGNIAASLHHPSRIANPAVRRGWLEDGPGADDRRGADEFVEVSWQQVDALLAGEIRRVTGTFGNAAIYGGSYGWASAGRIHHAQSQLHRFLNTAGGYVSSVNSYSTGAATVILPHVVGSSIELIRFPHTWPVVAEHTRLWVAFGGVPSKNISVSPGGVTSHSGRSGLQKAAARGMQVVNISPLGDDVDDPVGAEWVPIVPGTDVAMMLALAHTLITERLHDAAFVAAYTDGYAQFAAYLNGASDGVVKDAEWASAICGIDAGRLRLLARRMAAERTLITVTYSLQRTEHGEQPVWAAIALASLLGQIGLPGGGVGLSYGSMADGGLAPLAVSLPSFPQGLNPVREFIPVARVADMLLHPGQAFQYNGSTLRYPDIHLVWWAGGNPFHHHQDLNRLRRALRAVDTVVVQDPYWTAMARHADVVLPSTVALERDDLGAGSYDSRMTFMRRAVEPYAGARDDYSILSGIAGQLGLGDRFTEGRTIVDWRRLLYTEWRGRLAAGGVDVPDVDEFERLGEIELPKRGDHVTFARFRADPIGSPLSTPSGRIQLFSDVIAGFGYADCPGHPAWMAPHEWLGGRRAQHFPLHLIANQPSTRLHSQLDMGATSMSSKVSGREPIRMSPDDAAVRRIVDGDVVRVFNDRGSCLAGAVISDAIRPNVVQLSTGAWFDPSDPAAAITMCVHGNPNVLTPDSGSSSLAQGCSGQHVLVQIERWCGEVPPVAAHRPPVLAGH
jgi:biotin/methionine sulfoxide reductase